MKKVKDQLNVMRILGILAGSFLIAVSINLFLAPHNLLSGGASGVALIVQYVSGINSGIVLLLINVPIFILGLREIDKDFTIVSLIGMLSLSFFMFITQNLETFKFIPDITASSIYGGLLSGIGIGLVMRMRASTGGVDIISVILKRRFEIKIATVSFMINIVIVMIGGLITNPTLAIYTLISLFITSKVVDKILVGLDHKKMLFIVTDQEEEIAEQLMKTIKRGVTYLDGEGAYSNKKKRIIYCIVNSRQLAKVKQIVTQIDPKSFVSVTEISEIQGNGFKPPVL